MQAARWAAAFAPNVCVETTERRTCACMCTRRLFGAGSVAGVCADFSDFVCVCVCVCVCNYIALTNFFNNDSKQWYVATFRRLQ